MDLKSAAIDILTIVLVPFLTILAGQLVLFLSQWLKQRGLLMSAEQQAALEEAARKAILAAEEYARSHAKSGISTPSAVKFEVARQIVAEQHPGSSLTQIDAAIQSQLAQTRFCSPEVITTPKVQVP